jgi:hypothetical protein
VTELDIADGMRHAPAQLWGLVQGKSRIFFLLTLSHFLLLAQFGSHSLTKTLPNRFMGSHSRPKDDSRNMNQSIIQQTTQSSSSSFLSSSYHCYLSYKNLGPWQDELLT